MPAHVDPDRDGREHARDAERLRRQVAEVAAEESDRDLDRRVVEPLAQLADQVADHEADADAAEHDEHEVPARVEEREGAGDHRGDGEAVGDERGAVVDQALALDQRDQARRQPEPLGDRAGGGRIGRRDDCSEHERLRPAEAGDDCVRDGGDGKHRDEHEPDREEPDRLHVRPELAQRGEERAAVEQRRQHRDEHEVRVQVHLGRMRHEADHRAAEHQHDRVRDAQELRGRKQQEPRREQQCQQGVVAVAEALHQHGPSLAPELVYDARAGLEVVTALVAAKTYPRAIL